MKKNTEEILSIFNKIKKNMCKNIDTVDQFSYSYYHTKNKNKKYKKNK